MHIWTRKISDVLVDKAGIDTSIAELMVSTVVKVAVTASLAAIIGGVTMFSAMANASTQTSSSFQTSDLQFARAVHAADRIIGYDTGAVALLTDTGGSCAVDLWHGVTTSGVTNLREDRSTLSQACSAVAGVNLAAPPTGADKVVGLASVSLSYSNIGGRPETFDSNGNVTFDAAAVRPASVSTADWVDGRPYKINLNLASDKSHLTAFAKNSALIGFANIVNTPQAVVAPRSLRFVPSLAPIPAPVNISGVARSTTTGAVFGGVHEGITVTITGGECSDGSATTLVTKYVTSSPAGVADVSQTQAPVLTGQAAQFDLAGVKNGAQGTVSVVAACTGNTVTTEASQPYSQAVPVPTVSVAESNPFSTHVVSWNQVSSLGTAFTGSWAGNDGTSGTLPAVAMNASNVTVTHPAYGTYGVTDTYTVTATVAGQSATSSVAISHAWPAIPKASAFARTENNLTPVNESLTWSFTTVCPVGTTIYAQSSEDRTGQANGTVSTTVHATSGYRANNRALTWNPAYALQGYDYGIHVSTECVITSTGAASATQSAGYNFTSGMNTPGAPTWSSYNVGGYNNNAANTHSTKSATCTSSSACGAYVIITYNPYCPAGSTVTGTSFTSTGWPGQDPSLRGPFIHSWDWLDWWQGPGSTQTVQYTNAFYSCQTPWSIKRSNISGTNDLVVNP